MAEKYISDESIHDGHRQRMRAKFIAHGSDIFDTYELLEMLLYFVIPYKDTNPTAKRLLYALGSLDAVLTAPPERLTEVDGVGEKVAEFLATAGRFSRLLDIESSVDSSFFANYDRMGRFFVDYFRGVNVYRTSMLLLDNNMLPISVSDIYEKDCQSAGVTACPFITEAVKAHASIAVLAHTHPHGPTFPSEGDRSTNTMLYNSFKEIGVELLEHYIVSGGDYRGFANHFARGFSSGADSFMDSKNEHCGTGGITAYYDPCAPDVERAAEILFPVVGEKCREVASRIYLKYLSLERAACADIDTLTESFGERCAVYIKLLARISSRRVTDGFGFGAAHTRAEISDYLSAVFLGESVEKLYLISLDGENRILSCDLAATGTVNSAGVTPRRLLEIALRRKARSVILSHNHPRGTPKPSSDDADLTVMMSRIFERSDIKLLGHYVVSGSESYFYDLNTCF